MHHFCPWRENVSQMPAVSAGYYLMVATEIQLLAEIACGQLLCLTKNSTGSDLSKLPAATALIWEEDVWHLKEECMQETSLTILQYVMLTSVLARCLEWKPPCWWLPAVCLNSFNMYKILIVLFEDVKASVISVIRPHLKTKVKREKIYFDHLSIFLSFKLSISIR